MKPIPIKITDIEFPKEIPCELPQSGCKGTAIYKCDEIHNVGRVTVKYHFYQCKKCGWWANKEFK